jgi:hypothetical protein
VHRRLLSELEELVGGGGSAGHRGKASASVFKNWLINHTLVENRVFREFLSATAGSKTTRG